MPGSSPVFLAIYHLGRGGGIGPVSTWQLLRFIVDTSAEVAGDIWPSWYRGEEKRTFEGKYFGTGKQNKIVFVGVMEKSNSQSPLELLSPV